MGSVPNCQKEIPVRHAIRWFKCKLKPPKNWRGDQVILHVGNNSLFIVEHSGKEIEVSVKRKTDTNQFYGNTVWIQCISNGAKFCGFF